ncbi:phosphopantothenoylcysteine synthetase/decarboxylase [Actinomadura viridis]|uniref:Phosphopantothenoylcysteine synthetase/decarboxylase n=2 Tax=Actinomadura viridis TaxID=58110 RepID=A0A931DSH7_9ACTN|nr:phosphopantothenoylcysteine synthetase/decarboxylase [Actinomadura viridis]
MTMAEGRRVLYVIVCAAGPARDVGELVALARERDWDVQIVATPSAVDFIDVAALEARTGRPVLSRYRSPSEPRSPRADAIIVAPATYNTVNKWAGGITDTYALGVLAEAVGLGIPVVALPFVNTALAARRPFRRSVEDLREEGVRIIFGPGELEPRDPEAGDERVDVRLWRLALDEVQRLYG